MSKRILTVAAMLALPILLSTSGSAAVQSSRREAPTPQQQDTAAEKGHGMQAGRGQMCPGCRMRMMGGGRFGAHGRRGHDSPGFLLDLKAELELSDDQVSQLEKIRESHHKFVEEQRGKLRELHESLAKARSKHDWSALERGIDEGADLRAELAKAHLKAARQSLEALNDEQRSKLEVWREGHRLFSRRMMRRRSHRMQGREMMRPGTSRHRR